MGLPAPFKQPGTTSDVDPDKILSVNRLQVKFDKVTAVSDVTFEVRRGEFLGVVGESGAGKSATARAMLGLLPSRAKVTGEVIHDGQNLIGASKRHLQSVRGRRISYIFQDALTALDPVYTIGDQLVEAYRTSWPRASKAEARARALQLLEEVQISSPSARLDSYPHQLSGGMRQRVAIAIALVGDPDIVIADEPTSALDVTVQRRILELLRNVCSERNAAVVLITHDLGVVAETCDRVVVLYGGVVAEEADVFSLFESPEHPYTRALLDTLPRRGANSQLRPIPGRAVQVIGALSRCPFANRCIHATDECTRELPPTRLVGASQVRCTNAPIQQGESK